MTMEIESLACAEKAYTRAKPVGRWGAAQSHVVIESVSCAAGMIGTARQGCTTNSTGTRPGLPAAFSAASTTVSGEIPVGRPAGLNARRSFAGAVPPVRPTNASHGSPIASRALQDRVPGPVFTTARLSWFTPMLPTAAESLIWSGASERVAIGGGVLVSLSTWQVTSRIREAYATTLLPRRPGV